MSETEDGPFGGREIPDQITDEDLDREMFAALARIRDRAATIPPLDWLTGHARDAVRIAVCWAGFDCKELVGRLARVKSRGERLNVATVYRIMGEMAHGAVACADQFKLGVECYCTRTRNHKGDHFERRGNAIVASWPRVDNKPGQPRRPSRR